MNDLNNYIKYLNPPKEPKRWKQLLLTSGSDHYCSKLSANNVFLNIRGEKKDLGHNQLYLCLSLMLAT